MKIKERGPIFITPTCQAHRGSFSNQVCHQSLPAAAHSCKGCGPKKGSSGGNYLVFEVNNIQQWLQWSVLVINLKTSKMLIFNLSVSGIQSMPWGQWLPTYWWDLVCAASKAFPTSKTGQNFLLQRGVCCAERGHSSWLLHQPGDNSSSPQHRSRAVQSKELLLPSPKRGNQPCQCGMPGMEALTQASLGLHRKKAISWLQPLWEG